ncbi:MAG: hypothetical protein HW383_213 [Candidatus Magasanikbacteria bacterium]|nr:hypothetical protein [Candidatus Magasanikbacteria bacterium]
MKIAILGAGAMGTALAVHCAKRNRVILWSIEKDVVEDISQFSQNRKYLSDVPLPRSVQATSDLSSAVKGAGVIFITVPSFAFREVLAQLKPFLRPRQILCHMTKGIEPASGRRMSEIIKEVLGAPTYVGIGGPMIARGMAQGQAAAACVASTSLKAARLVARIMAAKNFDARSTNDLKGVEWCGILKNIYSIALGVCDGLPTDSNTKAVVFVKIMEEMMELVPRLGGKKETVFSYAGLGDLVTSGYGAGRNRKFGEQLCGAILSGQTSEGTVEGKAAVKKVAQFLRSKKIKAPILESVADLCGGSQPSKKMVMEWLNA